MTPIPGTLPHFLLVSVSSSTKKKKKEYLSELEHLGMMWGSKHNLERHGIHYYSPTRVKWPCIHNVGGNWKLSKITRPPFQISPIFCLPPTYTPWDKGNPLIVSVDS